MTEQQIDDLLDKIQLRAGPHKPPGKDGEVEACVMEMVACVAGEAWSDRPQCACPVITHLAMKLNDRANGEARQLLKPLIPRMVGTRSTPKVERKRAWLAADWAVRVMAPMALDYVKKPELAKRLRDLPEVTRENYQEARRVCMEVRDAANAAAYAAAYAAYAAADAAAADAAAADAAADAANAAAADADAADAANAAAAAANAAAAAANAANAYAREKAWSTIMPLAVSLLEKMIEVRP
jgi:hypothetical protein